MTHLKISFVGICGHYTEVVEGVPHRVVLPDASGVHMGVVTWENGGSPTTYCLLPHHVTLHDEHPLNNDLVRQGRLLFPSRLRVVNAVPSGGMEWNFSFSENVKSLTEFMPKFKPSSEVIEGHRAAAYFDFHEGKVTAHEHSNGQVTVHIKVETDGHPVLGLKRFRPDGSSQETHYTINGHKLTVANSDIDARDEDKTFDYLLHYLAADQGIPAVLAKRTPGLNPFPQSLTSKAIAAALRGLACDIERRGMWPAIDEDAACPRVLNASCSDTRYP